MDLIDDSEPTTLERSLHERLHRSAAAVAPGPDALVAIRARAADRRRRSRVTMLVASAAAVALVSVGAVVVTGGDTRTEIAAGPAGDSNPDRGRTPAAPIVSEPRAAVPDGDATLVIYRYPNATPEMIAGSPEMGGEWAVLHTGDRSYHANGPLAQLGAESPSEPSDTAASLALLSTTTAMAAPDALALLLDGTLRGASIPTVAPDEPESARAAATLLGLLDSGMATPAQASEILRLLESLAGVTTTVAAGQVTVTDTTGTMWLRYDPSTGHPLARGFTGAPEGDIEYLSVTAVTAADLLLPGRGTPLGTGSTTTTTTTASVSAEGR
jgi:hypothetical protein